MEYFIFEIFKKPPDFCLDIPRASVGAGAGKASDHGRHGHWLGPMASRNAGQGVRLAGYKRQGVEVTTSSIATPTKDSTFQSYIIRSFFSEISSYYK